MKEQFEYDQGETLLRDADRAREWPYWTITDRFYHVDELKPYYRVLWRHPDTWDEEWDVFEETDVMTYFERVETAELEQTAQEAGWV